MAEMDTRLTLSKKDTTVIELFGAIFFTTLMAIVVMTMVMNFVRTPRIGFTLMETIVNNVNIVAVSTISIFVGILTLHEAETWYEITLSGVFWVIWVLPITAVSFVILKLSYHPEPISNFYYVEGEEFDEAEDESAESATIDECLEVEVSDTDEDSEDEVFADTYEGKCQYA